MPGSFRTGAPHTDCLKRSASTPLPSLLPSGKPSASSIRKSFLSLQRLMTHYCLDVDAKSLGPPGGETRLARISVITSYGPNASFSSHSFSLPQVSHQQAGAYL